MAFNNYGENNMKIPLTDLKAQYKSIKLEIDNAIQGVLNRTDFILGEAVELFENEFAEYIGVKHALGVASGTDALIIALESIGVGRGDEVITTPMTFFATTEAILRLGATPIFVDIDDTGNIDATRIGAKVTSKTKAILPVHLFGNPCNLEPILNLGIPVIEDCAQACGAKVGDKRVGSLGVAGCFSFFPGKNLGCYGDGGMLVTNQDNIYLTAKALRKHGALQRYTHYFVGHNSRLDTIQAAVLRVKLKYLDKWNCERNYIGAKYKELLDVRKISHKKIRDYTYAHPSGDWDVNCNVYNYFCFYVENRDELIKKLESKGIATGIYFPYPIHLLPALKGFGYKEGDFPMAERHSKLVLALPMYPELTDEQVNYILEAL